VLSCMQKAQSLDATDEDVELQNIGQKIHVAQDKAQNFKEGMITLPPAEGVTTMAENMKLYSEINQLRAK
jgi:hypothetical protein